MTSSPWTMASIGACLDCEVKFPGALKIPATRYTQAGRYPIVDQGAEAIGGWTDDGSAVISEHLPLIVFGDHTRALKYVDFPFVRGADGTQLLKPRAGIDPVFFYFACRSADVPSRGYNRHFLQLKALEIPLPDESEQQAIGAVLKITKSALAKQDELVDAAQCFKRAAMRELFTRGLRGEAQKEAEIGLIPATWTLTPFTELREWLQYGTSVRCHKEEVGHPVLRIPNIEPGRVNPTDLKYSDMIEKEAGRYLLEPGDLLFIRTNGVIERLGACAVYGGTPERALFASYLIRARLLSRVEPRFAALFLGSEQGTQLVTSRATPAADGKYNLNTSAIDSFVIPLPPDLDEQREIVEILDAIDQRIDLHKRKKAVLEELFKALLHKLMTGEIRVSDLDLSALEASGK